MKSTVIAVCVTLCVIAICGFGAFACTNAGQRYNELASQCIQSGGSWVPGRGENVAMCLAPGVRSLK
jgi:hypothetical protein